MIQLADLSTIKKGKIEYFKDFLTLDTETSHTPFKYIIDKKGKATIDRASLKSWVYQWAIASDVDYIEGRYISDIINELNKLIDALNINENRRLVIYCHNLSYDHEYLFQYLNSSYGKPHIIATDSHKIISARYPNGLVFKCSYRLTNKSLEQFTNDYDVEHKKLVGYVDYDAVHYPSDKLEDKDNAYMYNDVVGQHEAIKAHMEYFNDTIASIPLTSTGYIRRMIYNEYRRLNKLEHHKYYNLFQRMRLTTEHYMLLKRTFAGGITHGNRFKAGKIIKSKWIKHRDFDSHYPTQEIIREFPMSQFNLYYSYHDTTNMTLDDLLQLTSKYCCLVKIAIKDLKLKDKTCSLPYAQISKLKAGKMQCTSFIEDNGRALQMDGVSEAVLTELDLKWYVKQYNFNYKILEVYTAKKGKLPPYITNVIRELYKRKTDLKNKLIYLESINASKSDIFKAKLDLLQVKGLLNSIYGMSATDPVKDTYELNANGEWILDNKHINNIGEMLDKYYKGKKNCMAYAWGVWCTAHARNELMENWELIEEYSKKYTNVYFIYADTDSLFYKSNPQLEREFARRSKEYEQESIEKGYFVELENGNIKTFHDFTEEHDDITEFKFLHAKCYGMISKGELDITVAGVPKRVLNKDGTYSYREDELGNLSKLQRDFTFSKHGGNGCIYKLEQPHVEYIEGHKVEICNSAIIVPTTKTLSELDLYDI